MVEPLAAAIEQLDSEDVRQRLQARTTLLNMGEAAVDALVQMLGRNTPFGSAEAAIVLGEIGDRRAVEPLVVALQTGNMLVAQNAAQALGEIGDRRAVEPLIRALQTRGGLIMLWAITSLGQLGDRRAVAPLIAVLDAVESDSLRYTVIRALGEIGDPRAVEPILAYENDPSRHVRRDVRKALNRLGYTE